MKYFKNQFKLFLANVIFTALALTTQIHPMPATSAQADAQKIYLT